MGQEIREGRRIVVRGGASREAPLKAGTSGTEVLSGSGVHDLSNPETSLGRSRGSSTKVQAVTAEGTAFGKIGTESSKGLRSAPT